MSLVVNKLKNDQAILILVFILLLSSFLFFFRLGHFALLDFDEITYAEVARDTMASGNYLSPAHGSAAWFEKPPLCLWLMIGAMKTLGLSEFSLRFTFALFGVAAILLIWLIAYTLTRSYWTAHLAALILLSCGQFVYAGRQVRMDVPVTAAILFSLYCFIRGWRNRKWYLGTGVGVSLGVMIKSIIGLLAVPVILIFCLVYKKWNWMKEKYFWLSVVLALALMAPWHIYQTVRFGGEFWNSYFVFHIWDRFHESVLGGNYSVFYYLRFLFLTVEPWFILFLLFIVWYFYKYGSRVRSHPPCQLASLAAAIFIFFLFASARTKLLYYLEPMYPLMALFLAAFTIDRIKAGNNMRRKREFIFVMAALVVVGLAGTFDQITTGWSDFTYEQQFAEEEKRIARYLVDHPDPADVYIVNIILWRNTLNYYLGGRVIKDVSGPADVGGRYYMIVPMRYLPAYKREKDIRDGLRVIMENEYISLIGVNL